MYEYIGFISNIAIAPAANKYGKSSTFATAISFLTGLNTYHDDSTRKNKNEPKIDSLEKDFLMSLIEIFIYASI